MGLAGLLQIPYTFEPECLWKQQLFPARKPTNERQIAALL
jgi:hypothetical protein